MKNMSSFGDRIFLRTSGRIVMLLFLASAISLMSFSARAEVDENWLANGRSACSKTSRAALTACYKSTNEDHWLNIGKCNNVASEDKKECFAEAWSDFRDSAAECREIFQARQEVCAEIGPGPYLPDGIDSEDFSSEPMGNEYFPLVPNTKYTYKLYNEDNEIEETIVVEVKDDTREINGVECRVVQDTVYEGDLNGGDGSFEMETEDTTEPQKIEDTTDWYAVHSNGDVWYFGEIALNFEDGVITNIDGSWTAGVEGAKPGIVMYGDPKSHIGETYRQEFALSEAEDVATIVEIMSYGEFELYVMNPVPAVFGVGPFLHTKDFSPLEPGVVEDKYYALGVGNVLVVGPEGEMEVLVEKSP